MKETITKVKRQPSEWEKIIANEATDKELISKIYKQLQKSKQPNQKMGQKTKQTFLQRRHMVPSHASQNGCYPKVYKQ